MALFLPDANVLIHALRADSAEHDSCRRWLTGTAAVGDAIGLCELVEAALLRIPTLPKLQLVPMAEPLGFWKDDLWS
jgi:predicted nucleic acid-binding protein